MKEFVAPKQALPLITIITPCLNGERHVAEALESVRRQNYPRLEHIFLDGCSTDKTLAIVNQCPHVTVISEPDDSSHHAMNKGLLLAHGEVIGFLNVDDVYPEGVFLEVGRIFTEKPEIDVVIGHTIWFEDNESTGRHVLYERIHDDGNEITLAGVAPFNACFFRRNVFDNVGNFETKYDFTADTHFLLRCALAHLKVQWLERPTMWYRQHANSRTFNPERRSLIAMFWEIFGMTAEFARHADTPKARRHFLTWNALIGLHLVVRNLLRGQIRQATRAAIILSSKNPFWPARLVPALSLRREVRKLFRRPNRQPVADI
jgi:glycosyltransferase involved in cell wall biosynthesis